MAYLKGRFNFTISQTPLKGQDTEFLENEFHIPELGGSCVWLGSVWNSQKWDNGTQCRQAVVQPRLFLCLLKNSQSIGTATSWQVHIPIASLGGTELVGTARENSFWGCPEAGMDGGLWAHVWQTLQSLFQSATSHFLCNMQGNCSCLLARLLYWEREKFTWHIVCQRIGQARRWDVDLSCTRDVLTIFQSLHYKVMFLLPLSLDKQHGALLPFPIWFSFVLLLHALQSWGFALLVTRLRAQTSFLSSQGRAAQIQGHSETQRVCFYFQPSKLPFIFM